MGKFFTLHYIFHGTTLINTTSGYIRIVIGATQILTAFLLCFLIMKLPLNVFTLLLYFSLVPFLFLGFGVLEFNFNNLKTKRYFNLSMEIRKKYIFIRIGRKKYYFNQPFRYVKYTENRLLLDGTYKTYSAEEVDGANIFTGKKLEMFDYEWEESISNVTLFGVNYNICKVRCINVEYRPYLFRNTKLLSKKVKKITVSCFKDDMYRGAQSYDFRLENNKLPIEIIKENFN